MGDALLFMAWQLVFHIVCFSIQEHGVSSAKHRHARGQLAGLQTVPPASASPASSLALRKEAVERGVWPAD